MKAFLTALLAFAHLLLPTAAPAQAGDSTVAFVNVSVVPMDRDRVIPGQTVLVRNGKITAIAPTAAMTIPADARQIDGTGRYLMPALAEMHAHVPPNPEQVQWAKDVLFLYLANGVTFARSMLGAPHHLELRDRAERGEILSPRIYTSGPSFNGNSVKSPQDGRRMVAEQKSAGYDFLKIHPGLDRARFDAIADAARASAMPFGGHVPDAVGIERAMAAGQATIDHLDGYMSLLVPKGVDAGEPGFFGYDLMPHADPSRIADAVRRTREAGVWVVPTESLVRHVILPDPDNRLALRDELRFVPKAMRESWIKARADLQAQPDYDAGKALRFARLRGQLIKALSAGGAGLLLGSDAPQWFNVPGFAIHRELAILVEAGLSPFDALATGNRNVARFLGEEGQFGTILPGARADLILLQANPLADVANAQRRVGVMVKGRWLPEEQIQAGLTEIAARYAN